MRKLALTVVLVLACGSMAMAGGPKPPATADLQVNNSSSNTAIVIVDVLPSQQSALFAPGITLEQQAALIEGYKTNPGNVRTVNGKSSTVYKGVTVGNHTIVAVFPDGVNTVEPADLSNLLTKNVQPATKNNKTTATISDGSGGTPVIAFNFAGRELIVASIGLTSLVLLGLAGSRLNRKAKA